MSQEGVLGIEPFLDLNGAARGYPLGRRVAGREPLQGAPERYAGVPSSQCACRVEREAAYEAECRVCAVKLWDLRYFTFCARALAACASRCRFDGSAAAAC